MRVLTIAAALALFGCADNPGGSDASKSAAAAEYRAITTQAEFAKLVIGKPLTYAGVGTFTIRPDGTLGGDFNGPLAGTWRWEAGYWCRVLTVPRRPEDCQLWESNGSDLRATRNKGKGSSFDYTY